uniref:Death domain-containing protein n=1 Tax=Amphimedon queenslandica TaxID=400682 RepID=A0A1X7TPD1_AMPQE
MRFIRCNFLLTGIKDLKKVITTLKRSSFPADRWNDLGLELHINQTELDTIGADNPLNVKGCLKKCLICWLDQNYDVDTHGKPTLKQLATAVKEMGLRAVADKIAEVREEETPEGSVTLVNVSIESNVHDEFRRLRKMFATLVTEIRKHLTKKVQHLTLETIDVARFIEEFLMLKSLTMLLNKKDDVDFDESLIEAVKLGNTFEVSVLLSLGADPYYEDDNGDSPMMLALLSERKEIARLFVTDEIKEAFDSKNETSIKMELIRMDVDKDIPHAKSSLKASSIESVQHFALRLASKSWSTTFYLSLTFTPSVTAEPSPR